MTDTAVDLSHGDGGGHPPTPGDLTSSLQTKSPRARRRMRRDRIMTGLLFACLLLALVPLALILFVVIRNGAPAMNWEFLTTVSISLRRPGGGWLHGLIGTLYMTLIATGLSVPLGVAAAVYLVEFRRDPLTAPIRFFTDVMTGVPSIFVGLFIYAALVQMIGFGTLVGALSLGLLMLPIVVRSAEEILKLVPDDLRHGAYALGARRWQTTVRVVLPAAGPGLVTGSMLAIARAIGETAPLILTAFGALEIVTALQGQPQAALTLLIFDGARSPYQAGQAKAWAGALELLLVVLLFAFLARLVTMRRGRRRGL
ncbi:MAG: phosphate ABC transporter permease PstA [Nitriliruptorales bacterium]